MQNLKMAKTRSLFSLGYGRGASHSPSLSRSASPWQSLHLLETSQVFLQGWKQHNSSVRVVKREHRKPLSVSSDHSFKWCWWQMGALAGHSSVWGFSKEPWEIRNVISAGAESSAFGGFCRSGGKDLPSIFSLPLLLLGLGYNTHL